MESEDKQISLTDPDARSMATSGRGSGMVGYNVAECRRYLASSIVAHEVTNVGSDRDQLSDMTERARAAVGSEVIEVVADHSAITRARKSWPASGPVTRSITKPMTSRPLRQRPLRQAGLHVYVAADDVYLCPAGEQLTYHYTNSGTVRHYVAIGPRHEACALKNKCRAGKERRISRWEHEVVLEVVRARLDRNPGKESTPAPSS